MLWWIDPDAATARQRKRRNASPSFLGHRGDRHRALREIRQSGVDVLADEIQLVAVVLAGVGSAASAGSNAKISHP